MYICEKCGNVFDEPLLKKTTYERYYGVSDEFVSENQMFFAVCPSCESEDYEKQEVEEDEQ